MVRMWLPLIVAMALLPSAVWAQTEKPLAIEELTDAAQTIRSFRPKDEFDVFDKKISFRGRRFVVEMAPLKRGPNNTICGGFPSWGYFPNKAKYEVSYAPGFTSAMRFRTKTPPGLPGGAHNLTYYTSFACKRDAVSSYIATNRFGVKVEVRKVEETVLAFVDPAQKDNMDRYWSKVIAGDDARNLSEAVRIRMSGMLTDWTEGKGMLCGVSSSEPTADLPLETVTDMCLVKARDVTFEVLDSRNGAILFTQKVQ